jgi:hypothetical protein
LRVVDAWLRAVAGRSPFDVELFHLLLQAGLSRRFPKTRDGFRHARRDITTRTARAEIGVLLIFRTADPYRISLERTGSSAEEIQELLTGVP